MDNLPYGFFTHRFSGKKACETFWVFMFHLFQPASFYQFISFNNIQIKKNKQNQIMQDVFILGLPDSLRWFMDGFFHRVRQFPVSPLIIFEMKLLLHLPVIANNATFSTMPNAMPARPYSPLEFLQNRGLPTPLKKFFLLLDCRIHDHSDRMFW